MTKDVLLNSHIPLTTHPIRALLLTGALNLDHGASMVVPRAPRALTRISPRQFLSRTGMGSYSTIYDICLQQAMAFMLEWWFGTGEEGGQELPPFEDFVTVNNAAVSV